MSLETALLLAAGASLAILLVWRLLSSPGRDASSSQSTGAVGGRSEREPTGARNTRKRRAKRVSSSTRGADASGMRPRPRRPLATLEVKPLDPADLDAFEDRDEDSDDLTVVRVDVEPTGQHRAPSAVAELYVADTDADVDEPTREHAVILTSAAAQSDLGRKRKRNDDRYLKLDSHHVYAVADGMGGYAGGDIAAQIAVDTLARCFRRQSFDAVITSDHELSERATQLVRAVQEANLAIYQRGKRDKWLKDMGTTLVAARFAPRKERLYIAHVGDSRCYRLRGGRLAQLTSDHTLGAETDLGVDDPSAACLSRAVGVASALTIDVIVAKPQPGDVYLLCTDGLTGMIREDTELCDLLEQSAAPSATVRHLVDLANERGGRDNVTALVVRVDSPSHISEFPPSAGVASA